MHVRSTYRPARAVAVRELVRSPYWSASIDLSPGAVLFQHGQTAREVFCIEEGMVRLVRTPAAGREITVGLRLPGSLLGGVSATLHEPHGVSAVVVLPTRSRRLSVPDFVQRLQDTPEFLRLATQAIALEFQASLDDFTRPFLPDRMQRLKNVVLAASGEDERDDPSLTLLLLRAADPALLADLLLVPAAHVAQLLAEWERSSSAHGHVDAITPTTDRRIAAAIELIQEQYMNAALDLRQLSRQVNMSLWHFSRMFKRSAGVGFREFLNAVRLERARVALLSTRLSVKEIAALVGYKHISELSRHFKAHHGVSPTRYRVRTVDSESRKFDAANAINDRKR